MEKTPQMAPDEIRAIESILASWDPVKGSLRVLEWGSGSSTLYYTDFLESKGIPYDWTSVEHDADWYEEVRTQIQGKKISLLFRDLGEQYLDIQGTFDFILIDGRMRCECLEKAKRIVAPGGTILMHDAVRERYRCATGTFIGSTLMQIGENTFRTRMHLLLWKIQKLIKGEKRRFITKRRVEYALGTVLKDIMDPEVRKQLNRFKNEILK